MFPRVTHPSATPVLLRAFDLHVLSLPPAFVLSQDQTLMFKSSFPNITSSLDEVHSNSTPKGKAKTVLTIKKRETRFFSSSWYDPIPKDRSRTDEP